MSSIEVRCQIGVQEIDGDGEEVADSWLVVESYEDSDDKVVIRVGGKVYLVDADDLAKAATKASDCG